MIKFRGFNLWDWIVSQSRVYRDLEEDAEAMYYALVDMERTSYIGLPLFYTPKESEIRDEATKKWLAARVKGAEARRVYRERR